MARFARKLGSGFVLYLRNYGKPKGSAVFTSVYSTSRTYASLNMGRYLGNGMKVLPVVPLFHVNAWGLPYGAPLTGTSLVFPGSNLDGASLFKLIDNERVNSAWGAYGMAWTS